MLCGKLKRDEKTLFSVKLDSRQGRRKVIKTGGASSNVVGMICLPQVKIGFDLSKSLITVFVISKLSKHPQPKGRCT